MTTLANFPLKNQLTDKAGPLDADGITDNPRYNCVPESFAMAIQYLTGKVVTGEELKDAEYGDKYVGGTALRKYVDDATDRARKLYGVTAEPFNASSTVDLIHQARAWLRQGFPVIATIPSQWGTAHTQAELDDPNFSTHCVVFFAEDGTHMGAANPWGGFEQAEPDEWWSQRLCYGQVWKIYKEAQVATSGVPTGWKDDGKTLTAPNGVAVVQGFRDWVLANKWDKDNWPLASEQVITSGSIEPGNASIGTGSRQDFRWSSLGWTQKRNVYSIWLGQDVVALRKQLADALAMIDELKKHAESPSGVVLTQQQKDALTAFAALQQALKDAA